MTLCEQQQTLSSQNQVHTRKTITLCEQHQSITSQKDQNTKQSHFVSNNKQ